MKHIVLIGDARECMKGLGDQSVHAIVTSIPYFHLRDYKVPGQIGLERTKKKYIAALMPAFDEMFRVLRDDGTLWCNIGDIYRRRTMYGVPWRVLFALEDRGWNPVLDIIYLKMNCIPESTPWRPSRVHEYIFMLSKTKKYYYDSKAVEEKASENERRRRLLEAEKGINTRYEFRRDTQGDAKPFSKASSFRTAEGRQALAMKGTRHRRSVWLIEVEATKAATVGGRSVIHSAVFPERLAELCIQGATSEGGCCEKCGKPYQRVLQKVPWSMNIRVREAQLGIRAAKSAYGRKKFASQKEIDSSRDPARGWSRTTGWKAACRCGARVVPCTVLDPFAGSGTTGVVAKSLCRSSISIELHPDYAEVARRRIASRQPGTNRKLFD